MNTQDLENASLDAVGDVLPSAATETVVTAVPVVPAVARKGAGRKVDTTGKTSLGRARIIYAENPGLTIKELKQKFVDDIGVTSAVAQTYASLVRKKKAA
jgi:hypothetical protein